MTDENLIHSDKLTEVMDRVVTLTNNALDSFGQDQMAEAIMSLWTNVGICPDAMTSCVEQYADACFEQTPALEALILLMPEVIISGALTRGIIIGMILGRENPR